MVYDENLYQLARTAATNARERTNKYAVPSLLSNLATFRFIPMELTI